VALGNLTARAEVYSGAAGNPAAVQGLQTLDYLFAKDNEVFVVKNAHRTRLTNELQLPHGLTVLTNGVVRTAGGQKKKLPPMRKLTFDGFWFMDEGLFYPFQDHYMLIHRQLYLVKDGILEPVQRAISFSDGTRLQPDGTIYTPDGRIVRMQDGQMVALDGRRLPATDQVMMKDGKVILFKDGSLLSLPPGRVMMMSDGTRVFGDGQIVRSNGQQFELQNGQRLPLPGAVMPPIAP
ncbi:MAG: hypothetical protein M1608_10205, partial [Candidatus Omnitrophica bacterium]|nr:hypothetical protein [Candidatus Omnitrophota bacterium]